MTIDPRITLAALVTLVLQAAGGFVWAGQAQARLAAVEASLVSERDLLERMARLEEQVGEARRALARIEERLETHR